MPLSEDEQRILHEIERSFYENDPAFAREVSAASASRNAGRNTRLAVVGFGAGLAVLLLSFASMFWLGAIGFLVMLGSAFAFVTNVRRGESGTGRLSAVASNVRTKTVGRMLNNDPRRRLRQRFNKKDE